MVKVEIVEDVAVPMLNLVAVPSEAAIDCSSLDVDFPELLDLKSMQDVPVLSLAA